MAGTGALDSPTARPDLLLRRVGSEWVLYDTTRDRAHVLNLTAAIVWTYCDGTYDRTTIADAIAGAVPGLDVSRIRHDIDDVLRRFADEGLLQ
jgi:hypothetical protein